jgi:hypothetical protein
MARHLRRDGGGNPFARAARVIVLIRLLASAAVGTALLVALGCSDDGSTPTSPSSTTTTTRTIAEASNTELFEDTLGVGSSAFYSFTVQQYGTVTLTLTSVGGAYVPSTVMMGIGLGVPSGTDCATSSTATTASGTSAQLTGTYEAGIYCAKIWDLGNLYAPARFSLAIAHP